MTDKDYYHIDYDKIPAHNFGANLDKFQKNLDEDKTSLGYEPPLDVNLTHIPTDWITIIATLGAAFFGALAAFFLNARYEIRKERERRRTAINAAMYSFVINLTFLLELKSQFLSEFNGELDAIREHAANYQPIINPKLIIEFNKNILPMMNLMEKKGTSFNGAFKKWDEHETIEIHAPETLDFFSDYSPDDLRIFVLAREQIKGVTRTIKTRNNCWEKYAQYLPYLKQPESGVMIAIFELLELRKNIQEFTDRGLALLKESIERIEKYNKAHYPKRFVLWRKFFKKKSIVKGNFKKEALALIPDRKDYIDLIDPPFGKETPKPPLIQRIRQFIMIKTGFPPSRE